MCTNAGKQMRCQYQVLLLLHNGCLSLDNAEKGPPDECSEHVLHIDIPAAYLLIW